MKHTVYRIGAEVTEEQWAHAIGEKKIHTPADELAKEIKKLECHTAYVQAISYYVFYISLEEETIQLRIDKGGMIHIKRTRWHYMPTEEFLEQPDVPESLKQIILYNLDQMYDGSMASPTLTST